MKKLSKMMFVLLAVASMAACTGNKQNKADNTANADSTQVTNYAGTYEGVMPAADCPGIYTLLAVNENGEYEMFQKYLERVGTYVSKGKFELKGDTIKLMEDAGFMFKVSGNKLSLNDISLNKISEEKQLAAEYKTAIMKEDKSGTNVDVAVYTAGKESYAEFTFDGKNYKLKENMQNTQEKEFTDGTATFKWNVLDPAPMPDYKPTLMLKDKKYTFTMISPANDIYVTKDKTAPAAGFDVLYLNAADKPMVKLLSASSIYTLPQTEASAKTAIYSKDSITWDMRNNRTAVLDVKGKKYQYAEEQLNK